VLAFAEGRHDAVVAELAPIRRNLARFGGSHAQRDALQRTLVVSATRDGRFDLARALLDERLAVRDTSVWSLRRQSQLRQRAGDADGATQADHRASAHSARFARAVPADVAVPGLHVETWGSDGTPVVLVHGSLATGAEEWECQRPLAVEGFRLVVFDRRGYGSSAAAPGEDYQVDAADIAELMGDGAHLVGHSYGGLGAMLAAALRPEATLSLTLLEAPAAVPSEIDPGWQALSEQIRDLWGRDVDDREWVIRFLKTVGSDPDEFPPEMLALAVPLVPVFRGGRPFFDFEPPLAALAAARFPKLVVSGGHSAAFDGMCAALARHIRGDHAIVKGAGHEIQFTGEPINRELLSLWRSSRPTAD
jgi:pimeloyl-ACP methyl ester carboxylesterase